LVNQETNDDVCLLKSCCKITSKNYLNKNYLRETVIQ
jgi:hypothetical protein